MKDIMNHKKIEWWICNIILFVILCATLYPIAFIVYKAFSELSGTEVIFSLKEIKNVLLLSDRYHKSFLNSIFLSIIITVGQTLFGILMAFVFSKFTFKFRDILFYVCVLLMILPTQTLLVQTYTTVEKLSLLDSYGGVIIPQVFLPIGVLFLRQYFCRISDSVIEASLIDGISTMKCLTKIILPMSKNGVLLLAFLSFVDTYSMYELPLTVLRDAEKFPLSLIFRNVIEKYPETIFVPAVLYMVPAVMLFIVLKDNIVNGMVNNE